MNDQHDLLQRRVRIAIDEWRGRSILPGAIVIVASRIPTHCSRLGINCAVEDSLVQMSVVTKIVKGWECSDRRRRIV